MSLKNWLPLISTRINILDFSNSFHLQKKLRIKQLTKRLSTSATGYLGNSNSRCRFHHSHKKWKDLHSRSLSVSYDYDTVLTYFTSSFLWLWYCVDIFHIKFLMTMILCWHILHQVSYDYDTVLTYFTSSFLWLWYCVDIFYIKFLMALILCWHILHHVSYVYDTVLTYFTSSFNPVKLSQ